MRICWITAGAVAALAAAEPAFGAQCATVTFSPGNVTLPNYDPIAGSEIQASFTATITRVSPATTKVRLIFVDSDTGAGTIPRIGAIGTQLGPAYNILDPGGNIAAFSLNSDVTLKRNPTISLPVGPSGDSVSVSYLVDVLSNSLVRDYRNGNYGETLTYSIQCFQGLISQGSDTQLSGPNLSVTVPNLVSMTTASPQTLDFQNFTMLTQQLNVGLKSTGPVDVELITENQRRMVLVGAPSPAPLNSYIAYRITLNGRSITTDPYVLTNAPRIGGAGRAWPLLLSLPSQPSGKVAGSYSDTITLTITPGS